MSAVPPAPAKASNRQHPPIGTISAEYLGVVPEVVIVSSIIAFASPLSGFLAGIVTLRARSTALGRRCNRRCDRSVTACGSSHSQHAAGDSIAARTATIGSYGKSPPLAAISTGAAI